MKANTSIFKSAFLAIALFTMMPTHAWKPVEYSIRIHLTMTEIRPEPLHPRTPVKAPEVGQDGYTLYFPDETDFYVNLYAIDDDGEETLEYSVFVSAATTSVQLPETLSGIYAIEVIRGSQHFRGEIEL